MLLSRKEERHLLISLLRMVIILHRFVASSERLIFKAAAFPPF
jgi:hypothetical protein